MSKAHMPAGERKLRQLLARSYAGRLGYFDGGELQDNSAMPYIDFLRDEPEVIEQKMKERTLRLLHEQMTTSQQAIPNYHGANTETTCRSTE